MGQGMDTRSVPPSQQAEQILDGLRAQVRLAADRPHSTCSEESSAPSVPPVRHFVAEMESRWTIAGEPAGSRLPLIGPAIDLLKLRITRWLLAPTRQQQVDFNACTVRFAQRVDRGLLDLNVIAGGLAEGLAGDEAGRDRTTVDLQREIGALRVLLRQQQRRLEEAERQLAASQEEIRLVQRRIEQDRRPAAAAVNADGPAPERSRPAMDYYRFELKFRGTPDMVREHFRQYVPCFAGASDVLDVGCGRGEFMELLREVGVSCRGVDLDADMVAACHEKRLEVVEADALAYLRAQEDSSLGGAFLAQLVEHLEPATMVELIHLLGRKLRPGAPVVTETINPQSLLAASSHFLLDLSHVRLVHPETLKFLLEGAGFSDLDTRYTSPVPEALQLEGMFWPDDDGPLDAMCIVHNRNMEKLNGFLYGYQDYAVMAKKRNE